MMATVNDGSKGAKIAQLVHWDGALAAARRRAYRPSPEDVRIPWAHGSTRRTAHTEVCTPTPFPALNRITLFLRTSMSSLAIAHKISTDFFGGRQLTVKQTAFAGNPTIANFAPSTSASLVSPTGQVVLAVERAPGDHMYGPNVLALTNTITETRAALERLATFFPSGCATIVLHDASEVEIATVMGYMTLVRRTGVERMASSASNLTTIFELHDFNAPVFESPPGHEPHGLGAQVVGRCVLAYRDSSIWASAGPTITSIAIRRDYHGSALIQDLFNAVEAWVVEAWRLDTLQGSRVLKATRLMDVIVDRAMDDEQPGGPQQELQYTDKIFFFEVMGFTVNRPAVSGLTSMGTNASTMSPPPDNEGLKYYPPTGTTISLPTVDYVDIAKPGLWRSCDNCQILCQDIGTGDLLVCGGCLGPSYWAAHYCSEHCQRADWGRHKLWCNKTYDEVCQAKAAFERRG